MLLSDREAATFVVDALYKRYTDRHDNELRLPGAVASRTSTMADTLSPSAAELAAEAELLIVVGKDYRVTRAMWSKDQLRLSGFSPDSIFEFQSSASSCCYMIIVRSSSARLSVTHAYIVNSKP